MRSVYEIFFKADGVSPWITVICLLSANLAQGVGLASLLPLLTVATNSDSSSSLVQFVRHGFEALGFTLSLGPLLVFFVSAVVLSSLLTLIATQYVGYAETEITTRLRLKLTRLLLSARWSYFVAQPVGRLNHTLMGLTMTAGAAYRAAANLIALVIETTIVTIVALVVSLKITLVGFAIGLLVAWVLNWFVRRSRKAGKKGTKRQRELAVIWGNIMGNLKPLKAMERHQALFAMVETKVIQWRKIVRKEVLNKQARNSLQEILFALLLGIGAYVALVYWAVPVVELIVVGVVLSKAVKGVGKIQAQYQRVVVHEYPFRELQGFIREVTEAAEHDSGVRIARLDHGSALENVTFSYGQDPVLSSVTIKVPVGEITVLTGPSGAGKTTISDLILGLHRPQEGEITIDGLPLDDVDLGSWRKIVGYVPQELVLFHDTIFANIQLGDPSVTAKDVERAVSMAGAKEFVGELREGVYTIVGGAGGARLSGGQRQRIALARAIVTNPRLLVLDEVTSALDPESEGVICANVLRLAKDENKAVLAITHRPAFLDIADSIYQVADGQLKHVRIDADAREHIAEGAGS